MSTSRSRILTFKNKFKEVDLANYFQLQTKPLEKIHIHTEVEDHLIHLQIKYEKMAPSLDLSLPPELIRLIGEYLSYSILVHTKIEYSLNYPFVPPVWFMEEVKHNMVRHEYEPFYLLDYYIAKLKDHNRQYNRYIIDHEGWNDISGIGIRERENDLWTPAISVEKDILVFLQRIYHFEEMDI